MHYLYESGACSTCQFVFGLVHTRLLPDWPFENTKGGPNKAGQFAVVTLAT